MRLFAFLLLLVALAAGLFVSTNATRLTADGTPGRLVIVERAKLPPPKAKMQTNGATVRVDRSEDGHYYVEARLDGRPLTMLVDTGASAVALARKDARALGIDPPDHAFVGEATTAGGPARIAPIVIRRLQVGPIVAENVPAAVIDVDRPMPPLLGQSFLGELAEFSVRDGELVMR